MLEVNSTFDQLERRERKYEKKKRDGENNKYII